MNNCTVCATHGVDRPVKARGLCTGHLTRFYAGMRGEELTAPVREYVPMLSIKPSDYLKCDRNPSTRPLVSFEDEQRKFQDEFMKWLGVTKRTSHVIPSGSETNYVTHGLLSDFHAPFYSRAGLMKAIRFFLEMGVSVVWVVGDLIEQYAMSRFIKYQSVPIREEYIAGRVILDALSKNFHEVNIIEGNHENRETKALVTALGPDVASWVMEHSTMERIAMGYKNVFVRKHECNGVEYPWIHPIGEDAVIAHAEAASKGETPLGAALQVKSWVGNWAEEAGFNSKIRFVAQAHTHRAGIAKVGPMVVCELGCVCNILEYSTGPRLYKVPQVPAATVFTQCDGCTLLNSIQQIYLLED